MIENSLFYDTKKLRMYPRGNGSGSRGNNGTENQTNAAISHQANFGESRNNPEVTPREGTEDGGIGSGLQVGKGAPQTIAGQ